MHIRKYNPEKDKDAAHRIWQEVGWLDSDKKELEAMDLFLTTAKVWVADIRDVAECLVLTTPGTIRYLDADLPLSAVTGVATSRIARKQGFAGALTAHAIADDAAEGALVTGLGIFDQGFYNRLGFGNGAYEHWVNFDPTTLRVDVTPRVPHRLNKDDAEKMHASRLARLRRHGACNLTPVEATRSEMLWTSKGFGLGYFDGPDGELTHHLWGKAEGEQGPYGIWWMAYQNPAQLIELLALLKNLGDQVMTVRMQEPPGIQLQDLLTQPFRNRSLTRDGKYKAQMTASAYWQLRMCDVAGCMAKTHLRCTPVRFNLRLDDPITRYLDDDAPWHGISGDYIVTLSEESNAVLDNNPNLPTVTASVGAFTRLWMGILPATSLAITDNLSGPPELLTALDWALRLPMPKLAWNF